MTEKRPLNLCFFHGPLLLLFLSLLLLLLVRSSLFSPPFRPLLWVITTFNKKLSSLAISTHNEWKQQKFFFRGRPNRSVHVDVVVAFQLKEATKKLFGRLETSFSFDSIFLFFHQSRISGRRCLDDIFASRPTFSNVVDDDDDFRRFNDIV